MRTSTALQETTTTSSGHVAAQMFEAFTDKKDGPVSVIKVIGRWTGILMARPTAQRIAQTTSLLTTQAKVE
jgi:hypothetical protein